MGSSKGLPEPLLELFGFWLGLSFNFPGAFLETFQGLHEAFLGLMGRSHKAFLQSSWGLLEIFLGPSWGPFEASGISLEV